MVNMVVKSRKIPGDGEAVADTTLAELHCEALGLVEDLRDYILDGQAADYAGLPVDQRALMCRARASLTLQLTDLMGWVLHRQAQRDGQLPAGPADDDGRHDAMGQPGLGERIHQLPQCLSMLMWRSNALYRRIENLAEGMEALPVRVGQGAE